MNKYFTNWKTTSSGILSIAGGAYGMYLSLNKKDLTADTLALHLGLILNGLGLIFARDYDKSSEQSGVTTVTAVTSTK